MPRNRTSSDSRQLLQHSESIENNSDSPATPLPNSVCLKQLLLQRAWEFWNVKQNEKAAIFYQTISFCMQSALYQDNEDIFSYIEKLKREVSYQGGIEKPIFNYSNFDDINKYLERNINSICLNEFPKEWTVVQLCKNFNPVSISSKYEDIVSYNTGISMAIFKHSSIKDMVMIEIKKPSRCPENVFEKIYKLNGKVTETLNFRKMPQDTSNECKESREKYWKAHKDIDFYVQDVIVLLKSFIGPWICALTGTFKNQKSIEIENKIKFKVYEFLKTQKYSEQQEKLILIIAKRTDLLSHEQIFLAITYILRDKPNLGYHDIDLNNLYDFLTWIKQEFVYDDVSCHPCILIVDELLDQLPFEMLNTQQEFTRVCSFANLKRLFERHSENMENGYIVCPTLNCQSIINPDGSLVAMENRMKSFFNYWLPKWKFTFNQKPSKEEFYEKLSQSDILVYCGHGSGLQLLSMDSVYNLKTKAVVFLFGCGSVGLTSSGLVSELTGAHSYYHIGNCPVVVGFLWTVTDFQTDYCTTKILSGWFNNKQAKAHWQCIDQKVWKSTGNLTFTKNGDIVSSESLAEIVTRLHNDPEINIAIKSALVYRGLPVIVNNTK
ncbi:CLUMA_CG007695, isoform A [Clunio marinus]|uniref:separase n=1 Tax=Clunio marinus TaxID=568069 RepID=A0A1J1I1U3_9DIPT|nr:CLUMA_CG007695, isoform A [Clunio marinus]